MLLLTYVAVTFSVVVLQWATSTEVPSSSPPAGGQYVLQKPDALNRKRRARDAQLSAITFPESQMVTISHIQDVCPPQAHLSPEDGRGVGAPTVVVKDLPQSAIPSSPSAEDDVSHFEEKGNVEEVEYRNGIV